MNADPQDNARQLYEIAATQGGYFTAGQALAAGYTYPQQHYHARRGNWQKIDRGIYRLPNYPHSEREDLIYLMLWSHNRAGEPQAAASHETALSVHEMSDVNPMRIHLTVPRRGFRKEPPMQIVLHRADLQPDEIEERQGYQVTTPLRTLLDVADSPLSQEHVNRAVEDALDKGLVRRKVLVQGDYPVHVRHRLDIALAAYPSAPSGG